MGIPFKRVTEAFDEIARARICQSSSSSGSEHKSSSADLSDLIDSFMQNDTPPEEEEEEEEKLEDVNMDTSDHSDYTGSYGDFHIIKELLSTGGNVKEMIRSEIQLILTQTCSSFYQVDVKRHLMTLLRQRGLDAGLCKSRWKKIGQFPAGDHEYVDVTVHETRYIIEVNLAGEFVIARPTNHYQSLLQLFPPIFVGKPDDLKQIVKLMGTAVRNSMKKSDLLVPPWRKNGYMLAKWFTSYKRTTSDIAKMKMPNRGGVCANARAVGFEIAPALLNYSTSGEIRRKANLRAGNLAATFGGSICN